MRNLLVERVEADTDPVEIRRSRRVHWFVIGAITVGAVTSVGAAAVVASTSGWIALPGTGPGASPSYAPVPDWPTNANGQTFGQVGNSPVPPDLIEVEGFDAQGDPVLGYVEATALSEAENGGPEPTSVAQALAQQEARLRQYPSGQQVPVYRSDGETQVGHFRVGG